MDAKELNDPEILICPLMSQRGGQGFIACRRGKCAWWANFCDGTPINRVAGIEDRLTEKEVLK